MAITTDWHIHTRNSCDCPKGISMETLAEQALARGIKNFGVSDHVHTYFNYPTEIARSKAEFDQCIAAHPELKGHMHFGVEVSSMSEWEVDIIQNKKMKEEDAPGQTFTYGLRWSAGPKNSTPILSVNDSIKQQYGIEYVVAGVHWALYCDADKKEVVDNMHRQYMNAIACPHTDILAHWLWWWDGNPVENPFRDFDEVPKFMKEETALALKLYDTAFEINISCFNPTIASLKENYIYKYLEYAASLQDMGVKLSIGSDNHFDDYNKVFDFKKMEQIFAEVGIDSDKNFFCVGEDK